MISLINVKNAPIPCHILAIIFAIPCKIMRRIVNRPVISKIIPLATIETPVNIQLIMPDMMVNINMRIFVIKVTTSVTNLMILTFIAFNINDNFSPIILKMVPIIFKMM